MLFRSAASCIWAQNLSGIERFRFFFGSILYEGALFARSLQRRSSLKLFHWSVVDKQEYEASLKLIDLGVTETSSDKTNTSQEISFSSDFLLFISVLSLSSYVLLSYSQFDISKLYSHQFCALLWWFFCVSMSPQVHNRSWAYARTKDIINNFSRYHWLHRGCQLLCCRFPLSNLIKWTIYIFHLSCNCAIAEEAAGHTRLLSQRAHIEHIWPTSNVPLCSPYISAIVWLGWS